MRKEEGAKDSGTAGQRDRCVEHVRGGVGCAYAARTSRESWTGAGKVKLRYRVRGVLSSRA